MLRSSLAVLVLSLTTVLPATAAQRTFVATSGSDANTASNCSPTLPCRGFAAALTVTDSGGEIIVLTSGGYGPVTINKSVSIIAPEGIYAGIGVTSGAGITISTAGVDVVLRGLTINGLGGFADDGIFMSAGSSLVVQRCTIASFWNGLYMSASARLRLLDSLFQRNYYGAYLQGPMTVLVSGSRFLDSDARGLHAHNGGAGAVMRIDVNRSEASGNYLDGFYASAASSSRIELNVKDSVITRNKFGIYAYSTGGTTLARVSNSLISGNTDYGLAAIGGGAKLVASGNKVTDNGAGLFQTSSAVLQSTGDNTVVDNTTNSSGTITSLANM